MPKSILSNALLATVLAIAGGGLAAGCGVSQKTPSGSRRGPEACEAVAEFLSGWGRRALPNPASLYCSEIGGDLRIEGDERGKHGICVLPDGTDRPEWELYCGDCDAQAFCPAEYTD